MAKYLDYTGLSHYDEKIKGVINTEVEARKSADTAINTSVSDLAKQLANYLLKTGGVISGDLSITGDLEVRGTTTTTEEATLNVKDSIVVTNSDGADLKATLAGFVIRLNETDCYGIMYDASSKSVKLGLGKITDGKFKFNTGEGEAVATRADSKDLIDGHLLCWDSTKNRLVDSGKSVSDIMTAIANVESSVGTVSSAVEDVRTIAEGAQQAANAAQATANGKQDELVSGENIMTINGENILKSGDLTTNLVLIDSSLIGG